MYQKRWVLTLTKTPQFWGVFFDFAVSKQCYNQNIINPRLKDQKRQFYAIQPRICFSSPDIDD